MLVASVMNSPAVPFHSTMSCTGCLWHHTNTTTTILWPLFPGQPGWAGARRQLMDFMVQGKINRGRHTDHPAGRHSIRTNQCPPPPSRHFFYRPDALHAAQPTVSKHWRQSHYITPIMKTAPTSILKFPQWNQQEQSVTCRWSMTALGWHLVQMPPGHGGCSRQPGFILQLMFSRTANLPLTRHGIIMTTSNMDEHIQTSLTHSSLLLQWWVVRYWRGYLSRLKCKWFTCGPADATATPSSLAPAKSRMA